MLALAACSAPLGAQTIEGSRYVCWALPDVLRDLQAHGVQVVFSSNVVRDEMQVTSIIGQGSPRRVLDQLLSPHGLKAVAGAGGRLLVMQDLAKTDRGDGIGSVWSTPPSTGFSSEVFSTLRTDAAGGLPSSLPAWIDRGTRSALAELTIPADATDPDALVLPPVEAKFLVVRLGRGQVTSWERIAYAIKTIAVRARARSPDLQVALEASPEERLRLLTHDLAPYLDACVLRNPPMAVADQPGRWWWRPADDGQRVLHKLLQGSDLGAELVLLDGLDLDPLERELLELIKTLPSIDIMQQPRVTGISGDAVRFLYGPYSGSYYLAVYATLGSPQRLVFSLGPGLAAKCLFPEGCPVSYSQRGSLSELKLSGENAYYLVELRQEPDGTGGSGLRVDGHRVIDAYEEVVKNQVFRDRQARKVKSLDVMELRHARSRDPSARQYSWLHRIIERRGELTEYHHLGVFVNGVPNPEGKLRVGRDLLAEASIELEPLEIELDRTYRYELVGEELVDGHLTSKIAFTPLRQGSYLSGTVWIDRKTGARRRMRVVHTGLKGPLVSREITRHYEWINDGGQCYWDWTASRGISVAYSREAWDSDTERYHFRYNRPDLENELAEAYAGDVPIHLAVPPLGHRWLVKRRHREHGRRPPIDGTAARATRAGDPEGSGLSALPDLESMTASGDLTRGDRVLAGADWDATTYEPYLRLQHNCSEDLACSDLGFFFHRRDLLANGAELFAGIRKRTFWARLAYPRVFGSDWLMNSWVSFRGDWVELVPLDGATGDVVPSGDSDTPSSTPIFAASRELGVGVVRPLNRYLFFHGSYGLRRLGFSRHPETRVGYVLPSSTSEHRSVVGLDVQARWFSVRAGYSLARRDTWNPWGASTGLGDGDIAADRHVGPLVGALPSASILESAGGLHRTYRRGWLAAGTSAPLQEWRSIGAQLVWQKGWDLDHFSSFYAASDSALEVAGFQPVRFHEGFGAVLSYNTNIERRVPLTVRLEGAVLRGPAIDRLSVDRLGIALESILSGPFNTDLYVRLGYGVYSSLDEEAGRLRSDVVLSRRF